MIFFDAHCDILSQIHTAGDLFSNARQWDARRALSNGPFIQVFSCFAENRETRGKEMQSQLKMAVSAESKYPDKLKIIRSQKDLDDAVDSKSATKVYGMLEAEGAEILGRSLSELNRCYDMGLRILTLAWNYDNEVCDSAAEQRRHNGLSDFGRQVVEKAQALGIAIDVSHSSDKTFEDVMGITHKPVIASHSNARALCGHRRNLTDAQIKAVAATGGVIGINFYSRFLKNTGNANSKDIIRHIEYIAALAGVSSVGFGCDFDGCDLLPAGIRGVEDLGRVTEALLKLNYSEEDVKAIAGGNFIGLMKRMRQ